ncbi:thioesterase family protein [Allobaculum mucilyticum]|uniref:thioesterase family protein n=1 Tax=Allobaculum mucilyticum TaxID=2834459 RepID=UPI001E3419B6|nr:dihydrolipoamide acyltransferase [Allobaculum mucilyticum]UNT96841.1 dihydrolipoamide acyltransferase [Allobaculum mucilyticum]
MEIYAQIYREVKEENLAVSMKSGSLKVLATPQMIAWMEEASCLLDQTQEGWTTVGIYMESTHDAPSPLGARIRIVSHLVEKKGKISTFEVSAYMGDVCIGHGRHKRADVNAEKFMKRISQ